jgi:hypothetical protein
MNGRQPPESVDFGHVAESPSTTCRHPTGAAATSKKMGLRAAVNDYCRWCIHDPLAGGSWRQQVGACLHAECPLWPHRPRSKAGAKTGAAG